jgi:hypothetical protein
MMVTIHTWHPRKQKRRVALPVVALVNSILIGTAIASSVFLYQRISTWQVPQQQVVVETVVERKSPSPAAPRLPAVAPKPPVEAIIEPPAIELVDISKPREPKESQPVVEVETIEPVIEIAVDVVSGRQVVDLPGEGATLRIAAIEGVRGAVATSHPSLAAKTEVQFLGDRAVYLSLSSNGEKLKIEVVSTLPQFRSPVSAERVAAVREQATKRHATASQTKAAIMAQIADIDAFLKDGTAKKLSVYNQGEAKKAVLRTQLEVAEIAVNQSKNEIETADRVYRAIVETLPKMRLIVSKN